MKATLTTLMFLLMGLTNFAQTKIYDVMYAKFGDIPNAMSSVQLKELMKSSNTLNDAEQTLMDEKTLTDEVIIPIGKLQNGKNMILIYARVNTRLDKLHMHSKTLSLKNGEIVNLTHYVLTIAKEDGVAYDGHFKRDGDIILFTNDEEIKGEWKATQTKYKLGKHWSL